MVDIAVPVSSSVIAFVTTVHAALLVIHVHRARGAWRAVVAVPALGFGSSAWALTTPAWLATGLIVHATWTAAAVTLTRPDAESRTTGGADHAGAGSTPPSRAVKPTFVPASVLAVIEETAAIRTFRFSRPPGFDFEPGQFLMVKVDIEGMRVARCYSISSPPAAAGYLEISVKRQGVVSAALHESVHPGDTVLIHPPLGRFTAPPGTDDLVLVAGGIGITPLISVLRHAVACQPTRRVTLLYSVRQRHDAAFTAELDWLQRRHPQLRVVITATAGDGADDRRRGRVDPEFLRASVPDLGQSVFLICGPLAMIESVREMLSGLGVVPDRVRFEAFEAAAAVAAGDSAAGEATGRLRLSVTGRETNVESSETLLDAAERAGARIASFCRAGICGTCRTRLVSGEVRCTAEALSAEDRARGYVLPCVSRAAGDCVLEA
jgi:glycine betaine catabolism B